MRPRESTPVVDKPEGDGPYVVAIKQLYATHDLQTALDMSFAVKDRAAPDREGSYLVTIKPSRRTG